MWQQYPSMSRAPTFAVDDIGDFEGISESGTSVRPLSASEAESFVEAVKDFFSPTGPLSRNGHFEFRPQQQVMAVEVASALASGGHAVIEAGTGVGKSLAYLVPAMMFAQTTGRRALICTHTINLQEQLWKKDIPFAASTLGTQPKAALLKGRSNYLCGTRLKRCLREPKDLFSDSELDSARGLLEWAESRAVEGTRSELETVDETVWSQVCSERGACSPKLCANEPLCFYQKARRQARDANLLILNHTLFFTLLGGKAPEVGFLLPGDFAIFDEAHTLENIASKHLGIEVTELTIRQALLRLYNERTKKGLLQAARLAKVIPAVGDVKAGVTRFFDSLAGFPGLNKDKVARVLNPNPCDGTALLKGLQGLAVLVAREAKNINDAQLQAELKRAAERLIEIRDAAAFFLAAAEENWVYWLEMSGRRERNISMNCAPLDVSEPLGKILFKDKTPCILASATLATGKGMEYFKRRIGGEKARSIQIGSPFDYKTQMRLHIVRSMPEPKAQGYLDALTKWVWHFIKMNKARALVLFTNYKDLSSVATRLESPITQHGWELLVQSGETSRSHLLERFRESRRGAVLFGTQSFWTGVDVPGDALSCLIITRLPFQPPEHPLTKARYDAVENQGGNPFLEISVPEAILQFRQGVGRLIRRKSDKGIVAILDSRIATRNYGREFLSSLPDCTVTEH